MITLSDLVRVSTRQVVRQRGFGVILSIALGITAFIVLSVLGREIRFKVGQDMVLMGGVNVVQIFMDDVHYPGQPIRDFTPATIKALEALPGVGLVSRNMQNWQIFPIRAVTEERTFSLPFLAVDEHFADLYSLNLNAGRLLSIEDIEQHRRVCLLGHDAAKNLYGNERDALGQLLFLGRDVFEVIGIVSGVMMGDWRECGFIPWTSMVDRHWGDGKITRLFIRAVTWEDVPRLMREIPATVRKMQDAPYLVMRTQEEQLERLKITFMWVETLLWLGIAASLMLGGFGIWYGTFAAVRARTKEVGLKKAMGGSDADILVQFLAEALCKSIAGGALGIILGVSLVELGAVSLGIGISYPLLFGSSLGSIFFSAFIGVAGGLYPAVQASRMDVVSALRFE
ncbi:MAG: ABC transporter permease [Desulfovibrionaceae bacterium]|nr:ABC transporter permease [Desulfovibrionaceae bacterium]